LKPNQAEAASNFAISRILKRPEMHSKLQFRDFETFQKYFKQLKPKVSAQTLAGRRKTAVPGEQKSSKGAEKTWAAIRAQQNAKMSIISANGKIEESSSLLMRKTMNSRNKIPRPAQAPTVTNEAAFRAAAPDLHVDEKEN
jgi:hypothetical protein